MMTDLQAWLLHASQTWLPLALDASLKGAAVLVVAGAVTLAMRRASAAARQAVWLLALSGLLALPVLSLALPGWRVLPNWAKLDLPATPAEQSIQPDAAPAMTIAGAPDEEDVILAPGPALTATAEDDRATSESPAAMPALPPPVPPPPAAAPVQESPWQVKVLPWAMAVWMLGAAAALAPLLLGRLGLWAMRRVARPVTDPKWQALVERAKAALGLRRRVLLLESPGQAMPMIWGLLAPRLLLPAEAEGWSDQRKWVVLLHELGHVKRWDCATKLVAHLACALYWFNPLAWLAFVRLQAEAEAACDDLVLASGHEPCDYADHLLHIASGLRAGVLSAHSSIAMARKSKLEGRLLAILDGRRNRRSLTRLGLLAAAVVVTAVVIPLSILKATAPDEKKADGPATPATQPGTQPGAGTLERLWDDLGSSEPGVTPRKGTSEEWIKGRVIDRLGRPVQGAMVSLLLADSHEVKTDSEGGFRYPLPSEYLEGGALKRRTYAFVSCPERNLAGVAEIDGLHYPVTVRLQPAITLRGRVLDAGGKTVPGARIGMVVHDPAPEKFSWRGGFQHEKPTFDADGKFEIIGLPAGCRYTLSTGAPGFGQASQEVDTRAARDGVLEIPPTVLRAANLAVSGIVIGPDDRPVGGARVFVAVTRSDAQHHADTVADPQGRFKIDGVCSGRLTLRAEPKDQSMQGVVMAEAGEEDVRVYLVSSRGACVLPSADKPVTLVGRPLPDLSDVGLEAYAGRGKPLLICFWNSAEVESQQALCDLSARRAQLAAKGVTALGVLAFARNQQHLRYWLDKQAVDMPMGVVRHESLTDYVGMVRCLERWGESSLPWLIIANEAGIVQAEGFQIDDLDQAVELVRVARPRHESPTQPATRPATRTAPAILVQCQFLRLDKADEQQVRAWLAGKTGQEIAQDKTGSFVLDAKTADELLRRAKGIASTTVMSRPQLMAADGQTCTITVGSRVPVRLPVQGKPGVETLCYLDEGTSARLDVQRSAEGKGIEIWGRIDLREPDMATWAKAPREKQAIWHFAAVVPDEQVLLARLPLKYGRLFRLLSVSDNVRPEGVAAPGDLAGELTLDPTAPIEGFIYALFRPATAASLEKGSVPATQPATRPADVESEADRLVRKRLAQVLPKVEFSGIGFVDVVQFMRDVSNTNIYVNWGMLKAVGIEKKTPVNVKLADVTFEKVLRTILEDVGGANPPGFVVDEGVITIATQDGLARMRKNMAAPPKATPEGAADREVRKRLARTAPKLEFSGIGLADVVQFLRDVSGCNIHVNWGVLKAIGIDEKTSVNLKLADVTIEKALRTILEDVGGPAGGLYSPPEYIVDEGVISISTGEDLSRRPAAAGQDPRNTGTMPATLPARRSLPATGPAADPGESVGWGNRPTR